MFAPLSVDLLLPLGGALLMCANLTVHQIKDLVGELRGSWVMCGHEDGYTLLGRDVAEEGHDLPPGAAIKLTGWLVRQD